MAVLRHELWRDREGRPMCCLAGPMGEQARQQLDGGELVCTFEAGCHFEAMTRYNELLRRGPYDSVHSEDYQPYPQEWLRAQRGQ